MTSGPPTIIRNRPPPMAQTKPYAKATALARAAVIRPARIEDTSSIRYLHATAFRLGVADSVSADDVEAFRRRVYSPEYVDAVFGTRLKVADLETDLVGTAAWTAIDDQPAAARICHVYVRPPFTRSGIARRLVGAVEAEARASGVSRFEAHAPSATAGFFATLGYETTGIGMQSFAGGPTFPLVTMIKDVG